MSDQKIVLPGPLLLVGCGKMGGALLRGWLGRGVAGKNVFVVDPAPRDLEDVQARGVTIAAAIDQLPAGLQPGIVLLAIKPQFMDEALPAYRRFAKAGTVFLSIAAGKTVAYLKSKLGADAAIVRSMPNTPAAVGRGMSVILKDPSIPAATLELCGQLLSAVGKVGWIDEEDQINAVTALSGGGPAYVYLLIEYLAEAGRAAGLPADLAMQLARETVVGSGELAYQSSESATKLREAVMSPKGTTIEALAVLMAPDGLQPLLTKAIAAATTRGREIAEGK
ncbi:pyrroline-5-carboxylate reductase [Dongia deserti]|uniref:pyrroline-5-carboxylate reductase n=1 Tax=Dongia deserti TaxID=2268030 RepID=UPI000E655A82|nr:pyrroline-5-carboxylate reductase [Dongia deserti]